MASHNNGFVFGVVGEVEHDVDGGHGWIESVVFMW